MSGLDPGDDELARARHQVRLMEIHLRAAVQRAEQAEQDARTEFTMRHDMERERQLALHLRDASALEHERERTRRQEVEQVVERVRSEVEGWDHGDGCDRSEHCEWRSACEDEDCATTGEHMDCFEHGHDECPPCECGRGAVLAILAPVARQGEAT